MQQVHRTSIEPHSQTRKLCGRYPHIRPILTNPHLTRSSPPIIHDAWAPLELPSPHSHGLTPKRCPPIGSPIATSCDHAICWTRESSSLIFPANGDCPNVLHRFFDWRSTLRPPGGCTPLWMKVCQKARSCIKSNTLSWVWRYNMRPNIQKSRWYICADLLDTSSPRYGQYEPAKSGFDSHRSTLRTSKSANQHHQVLTRTPN
jgi:hypothetical protein